MEQSYVKTSMKQRIIIFAIAFLLLAATIASYVLIVLNDKNGSTASTTTTRTAEEQAQLDSFISSGNNRRMKDKWIDMAFKVLNILTTY